MKNEDVLKEQLESIKKNIQTYLEREFDVSLGGFEVNALIVEVSKYLEPYYYNKGVFDSAAILSKQIDSIAEVIVSLEK